MLIQFHYLYCKVLSLFEIYFHFLWAICEKTMTTQWMKLDNVKVQRFWIFFHFYFKKLGFSKKKWFMVELLSFQSWWICGFYFQRPDDASMVNQRLIFHACNSFNQRLNVQQIFDARLWLKKKNQIFCKKEYFNWL